MSYSYTALLIISVFGIIGISLYAEYSLLTVLVIIFGDLFIFLLYKVIKESVRKLFER